MLQQERLFCALLYLQMRGGEGTKDNYPISDLDCGGTDDDIIAATATTTALIIS